MKMSKSLRTGAFIFIDNLRVITCIIIKTIKIAKRTDLIEYLYRKSNKLGKQRIYTLIAIAIIVPVGFYSKFYNGPARHWANDSLGGALYEIFWCLVVFFFFPRQSPLKIALWVFFATCSLEFLQLWHPPFLQYLRSSFIGRTILGVSFNWGDFPYYFAGSAAGYFILKLVRSG